MLIPLPRLVAAILLACLTGSAPAQSNPGSAQLGTNDLNNQGYNNQGSTGGPIRLRGNSAPSQLLGPGTNPSTLYGNQRQEPPPPYVPGEFEVYVNRLASGIDIGRSAISADANRSANRAGDTSDPNRSINTMDANRPTAGAEPLPIRRFGADLITGTAADIQDYNPQVPSDYLVQAGDEVLLTLWGSVDADLRLVVDRSGRISVPRIGAITVGGVKQSDLADVIGRRVAQVFKNFQLSTSLGQLRGIRVYVAGYVARPGSMTVSSLSTLVNALMRTGGPSAAGSFRNVQLRRGREVVTNFDLYDLLLKGDRSADRVMQPDDVVYIGPVGSQVAMIGSVNQPAIFELKAGETINDLVQMSGGFAAVADTSRLAIERLDERNTVRITQIELPQGQATPLRNGDVLRAFNSTSSALPVQRQNKRVRVEGEVARPGEFVLPPQSTIADALQAAGGLTPAAYIFGTEFTRETVRQTQQVNYDRALRDLETEFAKASSTQRTSTADEAAGQAARAAGTTRLVERLRAVKPTGRVVLQLSPGSTALPELALEDGDRLYIPPRPTTVGVFGSVFNGGSYLYSSARSIDDYLNLAGGPTRGADQGSVFVIRANGSVVSSPQGKGWFSSKQDLATVKAEAGDTVFVPEEINKTTFVQDAKDWTQILYQFGLGLAGFKAVGGF
jgi:protein involved in polysaccharide export with SLBB domain